MTFATRMQATTQRLVNKDGSDVTLRRVTHSDNGQSTFDPVTGTYTDAGSADNVQDYSAKVTPPKAYNQALIDGTRVQQDDFTVFLAAQNAPIVPDVADSDTTDTLVYNDIEYAIVSVQPKPLPDNTVAGYTLQLRA